MPNATAVINANLSNTQATFYDAQAIEALYAELAFPTLTTPKVLPNRKGRTIQFFTYALAPFTAGVTAGNTPAQAAEGAPGTGLTPTAPNVQATLGQYADFILASDINLDIAIDDELVNLSTHLGYPCTQVGVDDPKRQRARPGDEDGRIRAEKEIATVVAEYERFLNGENEEYTVPASRIVDRLDVKNCLMSPGRGVGGWRRLALSVHSLDQVLEERVYSDEEIITKDQDELVRVALVRYDGRAEAGDEILPAEGSYAKLYPVKAGDILISNIAASYGSMAVVPEELEDCVVSNEYTVLRARVGFDPFVVQLILRSPEVRSDILLSSSGANRTRAKWDLIKDIQIPYPDEPFVRRIQELRLAAEEAKKRAAEAADDARRKVEEELHLQSETADTILSAFKPPK